MRSYGSKEWVFNLPITSKVDVYSYGIVVLEIVIGKGPSRMDDGGEAKHKRLVTWVRAKMKKAAANISLLEEIIDPMLVGKYDIFEMEALVQVALQCVEEDKDERPTMSLVVEMVLRQEKVSDVVIFDECSDECSLMAN
ncbi:EPD1-interacting receptor-like cytoplasmic serine/threonine-protein kinase [Castanea sativa]|uniref:EPD1-interacting receptor-like cytoplasmic serine/threonine-protein kinase n=1 Tax=Castanea sativa TaxID=21020 RepID=UPI003F651BFD